MSSESDVEIRTALPKKTKKKMPKSPSAEMLKSSEPKKLSTKDMIHDALQALHTRKGVSLYAIKKFVTEKYNVDVMKLNYLIKKTIRTDLESGVIVQTKGTGISGSFKFAPKKKIEKPIKKKKLPAKKPIMAEKLKKAKNAGEEIQKDAKKIIKKKKEMEKPLKKATKKEKVNKEPKKKEKEVKKVKNKMAKEVQTPAKKRAAMMKRKSIGSIIKPPKMKPKAN